MKDKQAREVIVEMCKAIDSISEKLDSLHDRIDEIFEDKEEWILGECSNCGKSQLQLRRTRFGKIAETVAPECTFNHN